MMRRVLRPVCYLVVLAGIMQCLSISAYAHPRRGSAKWRVLLCTFQESPPAPHDPAYYRNMFFAPGMGGMADSWSPGSNGGINFQGSEGLGRHCGCLTARQ